MTPRCRKILVMAADAAAAAGQHYIGTEHLLLALAVEEDGIAGQILQGLGVQSAVEIAARGAIGRGGQSDYVAGNSDDAVSAILGPGGGSNFPIVFVDQHDHRR
jgi:ATP-dependent Clp protease ATP-binding subunit ClpA